MHKSPSRKLAKHSVPNVLSLFFPGPTWNLKTGRYASHILIEFLCPLFVRSHLIQDRYLLNVLVFEKSSHLKYECVENTGVLQLN